MEGMQLQTLAKLRAVIGYLGEREQYAWWQSAFFSPDSPRFLAPAFGRTVLLAQCVGVARAAGLVHDERIGVGRVYHLFRLPEDMEQGMHEALHDLVLQREIAGIVAAKATALQYLRSRAGSNPGSGVGPVELGHARDLHDQRHWNAVAARYLGAFSAGVEVYPYFRDQV
jgi:hypothetical protein